MAFIVQRTVSFPNTKNFNSFLDETAEALQIKGISYSRGEPERDGSVNIYLRGLDRELDNLQFAIRRQGGKII